MLTRIRGGGSIPAKSLVRASNTVPALPRTGQGTQVAADASGPARQETEEKMASVRRVSLVLLVFAIIAGGLFVASSQAQNEAELSYEATSSEVKVASLMRELDTMGDKEFYALDALEVKKFHVPPDSVDVMRARVTETYTVDGIGEDTVELSGWVAVKHHNARPVDGSGELTWENAVVDTEFIGMDLKGVSDVFGRVEVRLDPSQPSRGQVGRIQIPELARVALLAELETTEEGAGAEGTEGEGTGGEAQAPRGDLDLETDAIDAAACVAPMLAEVRMPDLGLTMKATRPVEWFSLVETIPPVGHVASIAVEPVRLTSEGREVATLVGGKVHFREIVRSVVLDPSQDVQLATN